MPEESWWGAALLERSPHDVAWVGAGREVTVGRVRAETSTLADLLHAHGIRGGYTVALHGRPSFTQLWCLLALWSIGAQVLLFEPRIGGPEQRAMLSRCVPQFLVTVGGLRSRCETFVDECEVLVRRLPGGRAARSGHCLVQFSSGTTGRSKAVGRTPESLVAELDRLRTLPEMPEAGERLAVLGSAAHSFGLISGMLYALDGGATAIFPAAQTLHAIVDAASRAEVLLGSPQHFAQLVAVEPDRLPRPRLAVSGGEVLSRAVFEAFRRRYGIRIGQAYGTTETGIVAADLTGRFGPPTVGTPVPGIRTRIVGGVLEVHVPQSPYLYQDQPWTGGWMSTHDLVSSDPTSGALRLRGRAADGWQAQVDLVEIESVLAAHSRVTEAVVLGGDPIEAHVAGSTDLDHAQLSSWCRQFLGDGSVPARYHIVRELRRTPNGKAVRCRIQSRERAGDPRAEPRPGEEPSGWLRTAIFY